MIYSLHLRMSLIVPASIPRPLPTEVEVEITLQPTATAAEIGQVLQSAGRLLDSYAQALTKGQREERPEA